MSPPVMSPPVMSPPVMSKPCVEDLQLPAKQLERSCNASVASVSTCTGTDSSNNSHACISSRPGDVRYFLKHKHARVYPEQPAMSHLEVHMGHKLAQVPSLPAGAVLSEVCEDKLTAFRLGSPRPGPKAPKAVKEQKPPRQGWGLQVPVAPEVREVAERHAFQYPRAPRAASPAVSEVSTRLPSLVGSRRSSTTPRSDGI
mmetsp:Transcript_90701/g.163720  ORF Transcript_90701/g.163720 Transcript_90701/m.163720 type:complete len:200 (-) Transcript_90701:18-617(-)